MGEQAADWGGGAGGRLMEGIPRYCRPDPGFAVFPVHLKSSVVTVPACAHGLHGEHSVEVRVGGEGIPFVIAHGYTARSHIYELVLGLTARFFKVVGIDLAGHGGTRNLPRGNRRMSSYADLFTCTLDQLGIRRAVLVGHSLGGRVAAEAAANRPDLAMQLILVNAVLGEPWDARTRRIRRIPPLALVPAGNLVRDILGLALRARQTDQSAMLVQLGFETYLSHLLAPWRLAPAGLAILGATPSEPILRTLREHRTETVVLYGEHDPIVSRADAESTAELTGGRLIVVHGSHSWLLQDRRTLPDILESELRGELGRLLDREVTSAGLDPGRATKEAVETDTDRFYQPEALAHRLTPPVIYRYLGWRPPRPLVSWRHHDA